MHTATSVRLSVKDGPVVFRNGNGTGVSGSYELGDGMVASEYFPPTTSSAFYCVTLEKPALDVRDVWRVERELISTLLQVASAWCFSGGSYMQLDTRTQILSPRFESTAGQVEKELLARSNAKPIIAQSAFNIETAVTYTQPPLRIALQITQHMKTDFKTEQLLDYYYKAQSDHSGWFIHLYKICDIMKCLLPTPARRAAFGIDRLDWSAFERSLNAHDLRHASRSKGELLISREEVFRLHEIARSWISLYLVHEGLPAV